MYQYLEKHLLVHFHHPTNLPNEPVEVDEPLIFFKCSIVITSSLNTSLLLIKVLTSFEVPNVIYSWFEPYFT